jgi:uncharacterized protein (TIGR02217 family)
MAFLETPRFPDDIAAWAQGGAGYSTSIVLLNNGFEQRNINWQDSIGQWDISSGLRTEQDKAAAIAFFRAMKGKANGFRFKDFMDFQVAASDGTFVATGAAGVIQCVKNYTVGAQTDTRIIQKLVAAPFKLYKLGVLQSSPSQYTVDVNTGKVTPVSFTSIGQYTWEGEFDVPVRFDIDNMVGGREAQGGFFEWSSIPIVEIRV